MKDEALPRIALPRKGAFLRRRKSNRCTKCGALNLYWLIIDSRRKLCDNLFGTLHTCK